MCQTPSRWLGLPLGLTNGRSGPPPQLHHGRRPFSRKPPQFLTISKSPPKFLPTFMKTPPMFYHCEEQTSIFAHFQEATTIFTKKFKLICFSRFCIFLSIQWEFFTRLSISFFGIKNDLFESTLDRSQSQSFALACQVNTCGKNGIEARFSNLGQCLEQKRHRWGRR